jgi:hypothetical protein
MVSLSAAAMKSEGGHPAINKEQSSLMLDIEEVVKVTRGKRGVQQSNLGSRGCVR